MPERNDRRPPFAVDTILEKRGVRYRVTRDYVPAAPGYVDVGCFELVQIDPPTPFLQARGMADYFTIVEEG